MLLSIIHINKQVDKQYNENYQKLEKYVGEGFIIARENSLVFENLLILMIPADIEELDSESISKTMNNFMLDTPNLKAIIEMKSKISEAFHVQRRRFDNWFRLRCAFTKKLAAIKCFKSSEKEEKRVKPKKYTQRKYKYLDE